MYLTKETLKEYCAHTEWQQEYRRLMFGTTFAENMQHNIIAHQDLTVTLHEHQNADHSNVRTTVCWGWQQRKHQICIIDPLWGASIQWWLVDSPHKGPIIQKMFPCHDVIMYHPKMWQVDYSRADPYLPCHLPPVCRPEEPIIRDDAISPPGLAQAGWLDAWLSARRLYL